AVVLERSGRVTVLNEPGPELADGEWELYEGVVADALRGERVLACSGSLPPGAPGDAYARLVGLAHDVGAVAIVDVAGEQLAAAVAAGADVVTPNLAEAEGLLHGRADETVEAGDAGAVRARAGAAGRARVERGAAPADNPERSSSTFPTTFAVAVPPSGRCATTERDVCRPVAEAERQRRTSLPTPLDIVVIPGLMSRRPRMTTLSPRWFPVE